MKQVLNIYKREDFKNIGKKKWIAGLLAIFFGWIGCQKFYLKNYLSGSLFVVVFLLASMFENTLSFLLFSIMMMYSLIEGGIYLITGLIDFVKNMMDWGQLSKTERKKTKKKTKVNISSQKKEKSKKKKRKKDTIVTTLDNKPEIEVGKIAKIVVETSIPENKVIQDTVSVKLGRKTTRDIVVPTQIENKEVIEDFIDVTDIEVELINQENQLTFESINWLDCLELPYERQAMKNEQVKKETLKLYCLLCQFTNEELHKENKTLQQEFAKCLKNNSYYDNLPYTFYCIAEGHVTYYYNRGKNFYDNKFSYDLLERILGNKVREQVQRKAEELEKKFTGREDQRYNPLDITVNNDNFNYCWWDQEGILRDENNLTTLEIFLMNQASYRDTKLWELSTAKKEIIKLYLKLWKVILEASEQELGWKPTSKNAVEKLNNLTKQTSERTTKFINSLLKVTENTVRGSLPKTSYTLSLNVEEENHAIHLFLPKEVSLTLNSLLNDYSKAVSLDVRKKLLDELYVSLAKNSNVLVALILFSIKKGDWKNELLKIQHEKDYVKSLKILLKKDLEKDLELILCYELARNEKLTVSLNKRMAKIVYVDNMELLREMIEKNNPLSLEMIERILELKKQLRKKITLDLEQVQQSKKELNETVDILKEFIEISEEVQEIKINDVEDIKSKEMPYSNRTFSLIARILENERIPLSDIRKIAEQEDKMPLLVIKEINQEFYEDLNDQLLTIQDDYITIEIDYIEYAKEILQNEE
ncbi:tellurite resistance TerB C-terminal domain-containing protein [Vagococcus fluvialis]|uniref:tellurite resistance TerB C-terminal domain-containing protein n=1 Tax=Vagococcus fluvialis TaxID=2738 RepID=UPI003B5ACB03